MKATLALRSVLGSRFEWPAILYSSLVKSRLVGGLPVHLTTPQFVACSSTQSLNTFTADSSLFLTQIRERLVP